MKKIRFSSKKNKLLEQERGVSFLDVIDAVNENKVLAVINHTNKERFRYQKLFILILKSYVHVVPFVETEDEIFLKTIYPSRKYHRKYQSKIKNLP